MNNIDVKKIGGLSVMMMLVAIASPACGMIWNETITQESLVDPQWEWAVGGGGYTLDYGYCVATDSSGNCYVTGKFFDTAVFGTTTLTSYGTMDIFVAKLNKRGTWQWAVNAGGPKSDEGYSIAVDHEGNSYITGVFYDVVWFGNMTLTSIGGPADPDVFVAKLDTNGTWEWAVKGGGYVGDAGYGIAVDDFGNSYVTGHFMWSAYFGSIYLTSQGSADVFVAKLDPNGNYQWAVSGGGSLADYVCDIAVDSDGNTYLTGDFEGNANFGADTLTSLGDVDVFIVKLDSEGHWVWAKSGGSSSIERGYDIAIDSYDNAYVTGVFLKSITFGTITLSSQGSWDVYVVKLDNIGTWQWAVSAGNSSTEGAWGIAIDHKDNLFICGVFGGVVTIGESTIISLDSHDVFVASLDNMGTWQWAMSAGGTNWDEGYALTSDHNGSVYVVGYFDGSALFGNTTLVTQGQYDVFIAKLTYENGNPSEDLNFSIMGGIGVNAMITNNGGEDATNVPWLIHVEGGILRLISKTTEGTIDVIPAGQSATVKTGMFLGVGPIMITVRVGALEKTAEGKHIIIFSLVNDDQWRHQK